MMGMQTMQAQQPMQGGGKAAGGMMPQQPDFMSNYQPPAGAVMGTARPMQLDANGLAPSSDIPQMAGGGTIGQFIRNNSNSQSQSVPSMAAMTPFQLAQQGGGGDIGIGDFMQNQLQPAQQFNMNVPQQPRPMDMGMGMGQNQGAVQGMGQGMDQSYGIGSGMISNAGSGGMPRQQPMQGGGKAAGGMGQSQGMGQGMGQQPRFGQPNRYSNTTQQPWDNANINPQPSGKGAGGMGGAGGKGGGMQQGGQMQGGAGKGQAGGGYPTAQTNFGQGTPLTQALPTANTAVATAPASLDEYIPAFSGGQGA